MPRIVAFLIVLLVGALAPEVAGAQSAPMNVTYASGWNMAGGPPGTSFAGAFALDAYGPTGYVTPSSTTAQVCQGYWAYFTVATAITLPAAIGPTQTCALQQGWNLIANPFSSSAAISSGVTGYHWNPAEGTYDTVSAIPPGASAWIYSAGPSAVMLQYQRPTVTLEIDGLTSSGPFTVHVGDSIKLVLPLTTLYKVQVDPTYLHLESSGTSGDLTCAGGTDCAISIVNQFWLYDAVTAGTTVIALNPQCLTAHPACALPSRGLDVVILP
ncbi:MAG: hypothetical protein ACR2GA_05470 [Chloroflexota bacterium]